MTQRFIFDENIVSYAQKGEDEHGAPDSTCLEVFAQIIKICHTLVLDSRLWEKYQQQLNTLKATPQVGVSILHLLRDASQRTGKVDFRDTASSFPEETDIPSGSQKDISIIRLAVETKDILVTTDDSLKDDLDSSGVAKIYGLELLSPAETLAQL